ncbi:MAG: anti-sigma factor family protein [Bacteroidota bacterium]
MNRNPKELEEYLAAIADGEYIDGNVKQELQSRLENDPELSAALYIQTAMKSMLQSKKEAFHIQAPADLRASIMNGIRGEQSASKSTQSRISFMESFWNALDPIISVLSPKFAIPLASIIAVGGILYVSDRGAETTNLAMNVGDFSIVHSGPNNICKTAYTAFHKYDEGTLALQKFSKDQQTLSAFFANNGVNYPVVFPNIDAELVGGVVSQEKGTKFAQFIYKVGDHLIYAYEVPEGLVDNQTLSVNPRAMEIVKKADWYWEQENGASNTMVLWKLGNTLCVMVSDLKTEQLSALLHVEET